MFGLLLAFAAMMLVLLVISLARVVLKEGSMSTIRIKETGHEPELTLQTGQEFHLFNR